MNPTFQSAFNVVKGSVPARTDVPDTAFDACGKKGMKDLAEANQNEHAGRLHGARPRGAGVDQERDVRRHHPPLQRRARRQEGGRGARGAPPSRLTSLRPSRPIGPAAREPPHGVRSLAAMTMRARCPAKLLLSPSVLLVLVCVYGYIMFTLYLSFTVVHADAGVRLGRRRPTTSACSAWRTGTCRCAISWCSPVSISASAIALGLGFAILIDQQIRAEGAFRSIFLYPMALSFIVTGTAWKWLLDPGVGPRAHDHETGLGELRVRLDQGRRPGDLLRRHRRGVADVGFVMAMFLAGLRGVDAEQSTPRRSTARAPGRSTCT